MRFSALVLLLAVPLSAQTRRAPPPRKPVAPAAAAPTKIAPEMTCPAPLGVGVRTRVPYCEVMAGRDPAGGVVITIPPHKGPATLTFDLHNLHLYSQEQVAAKRAFARYTATIGALTADNTLLTRGVVQSEFRTAEDLVERISGGAGPGGVKAIAPTGIESISVTVPEEEEKVSLLGEKLTVETREGTSTYTQAGRPIAAISNVSLEYKPPPPPRPTRRVRRGG
jgi:hypothetical protein